MKMGTKSVLFGAHQFILHPLLVALGWWRLYGPPIDPRLWVAFFVHDIGYIGKPNMDGPEGKSHPETGAKIMGKLFGDEWHDLCLFHSRRYAKEARQEPSKLCWADKLAMGLEPWWLYIPRAMLSGEIYEYKTQYERHRGMSHREWFNDVSNYLREKAITHARTNSTAERTA